MWFQFWNCYVIGCIYEFEVDQSIGQSIFLPIGILNIYLFIFNTRQLIQFHWK